MRKALLLSALVLASMLVMLNSGGVSATENDYIWDYPTEREVTVVKTSDTRVVFGTDNGQVIRLNYSGGWISTFSFSSDNVNDIDMTDNSEYVVAGFENGRVYLWEGGGPPTWYASIPNSILSVSISPDSNYFSYGLGTGTGATVVRRSDKSERVSLPAPTPVYVASSNIYTIAGDSSGKLWFMNHSTGYNNVIWNYETGNAIQGVDISHDGTYAVAVSGYTVYVFGNSDNTPVYIAEYGTPIQTVRMSPSGNYLMITLVTGYGSPVREIPDNVETSYSPMTSDPSVISLSDNIFIAGDFDGVLWVFESDNLIFSHDFNANLYINSVSISSNGKGIGVGTDNGIYFFGMFTTIEEWTNYLGQLGAEWVTADTWINTLEAVPVAWIEIETWTDTLAVGAVPVVPTEDVIGLIIVPLLLVFAPALIMGERMGFVGFMLGFGVGIVLAGIVLVMNMGLIILMLAALVILYWKGEHK